ncbi:hypothetical protein Cni_G11144 [Canna indica]|uniref:Fungal lipase-like domain-containing protein n=1 Tax=Canna indica TaxID=4628 RepID=A0AAQ3K5R0_9LILI|nr:hypothetical protein Cni_G11144 [Canna indica]
MELCGLRGVRRVTAATAALNLAMATIGAVLVDAMLLQGRRRRRCGSREMAAVGLTSFMAVVRIAAMAGMGRAQEKTAIAIAAGAADEASLEDDFFRRERRSSINLPWRRSFFEMPEKKRAPKPLLPLISPLPRVRLLSALSTCLSRPNSRSTRPMGGGLPAARTTLVAKLRWVSFLLGAWNVCVILLGGFLMATLLPGCSGEKLPIAASMLIAGVRVFAMVGAGKAQQETAEVIVSSPIDSAAADAVVRHEIRLRYKRWLWWTRFGMAVTVMQFIGAIYLTFILLTDLSYGGKSKACFIGTVSQAWNSFLAVCFLLLVWLVVIIQFFTGSDILRWRSFYSTHDTAWKAHYREVFDHRIREALCCLGRVKYLSVLEEDEVYSVARLLGDLVAYRASGTGHLELLAGLALLQSHKQVENFHDKIMDAPDILLQEAAFFHQFAEAAYTGPLLDFGRNPVLFPCAWLYRQGILTPWTRNRRPSLEGDNWWRGHAAAFLKFVNLPPEALRMGRVSQTKREAAYFVVVLHDQKTIVIAVRGTETPEDLITDGLCRECDLNMEELDGLINGEHLPSDVRQKVRSSFHYGHAGIVESARELFMQLDGPHREDVSSSEMSGYLSSLLKPGSECHGYRVCVVGHSLGGAIATLLGLMLYRRYPNLHVYAYGSLPCLDLVIAEACTNFVTTIVYNDEFSARLSVNSIFRLRAAAMNALSDDSLANLAMIQKLARRILHISKYHQNKKINDVSASSLRPNTLAAIGRNPLAKRRQLEPMIAVGEQMNQELHPEETSLCDDASEIEVLVDSDVWGENLHETVDSKGLINDQVSRFMENQSSSIQASVEPPELFLPGCIIHIIQEPIRNLPFWKRWNISNRDHIYRAFVARRENFKDIKVTSHMFIDHLPWRCHYALQRVLEERKSQRQLHADLLDENDASNLKLLD